MNKSRLLEIIQEEIHNTLMEMGLNEMAKISGDLKTSIEKVISTNPDLEGLALKKAIKSDDDVKSALGDGKIYDTQLNKFIASSKDGSSDKKVEKVKVTKKVKKSKMDDEDKAAVKAGKSDATVKAILTTPEEKKEKFNLGLKFIKKYKDDKAKIDAYLKKAKEEYKLPSSMIKDLKRTAGRDVAS
jgi:acylphosphatase